MYRVKLSNTYSGLFFDFFDFGEAMGFVGQAIENGAYTTSEGIEEPIRAEIYVVKTEEVGL